MAADDDAKVQSAFLTEARSQWQEYVHRVARYEGAVRSQLTNILTGEVRMTGRGTVAVSGGWALTGGYRNQRDVQASGAWRIGGVNSMYSFDLSRDAEDAEWRIDRLEWLTQGTAAAGLEELALPPDRPVASGAEGQSVWHSQMRSLCRGLMLDHIWFPSMIESPDFMLQSVENVESEGEALVRVQFAYLPEDPLLTRVRGGFVILDPERYWLICEAKTGGDWGEGAIGEIVIKNEFDTSLDGVPLLAYHQMHWIGSTEEGGPVHNVVESWIDSWRQSSEDESDYRLSAFGLPEPQPPKRRPRLWIWIAVHAAFAGYLTLWCVVRKLGKGPKA